MTGNPIDVLVIAPELIDAISSMVDAAKEYNIEKLRNETERERIRAYMTVLVRDIRAHTAISLHLIDREFDDRAQLYGIIGSIISEGSRCNDRELVKEGCHLLQTLYSAPPKINDLLPPGPIIQRRLMSRDE